MERVHREREREREREGGGGGGADLSEDQVTDLVVNESALGKVD